MPLTDLLLYLFNNSAPNKPRVWLPDWEALDILCSRKSKTKQPYGSVAPRDDKNQCHNVIRATRHYFHRPLLSTSGNILMVFMKYSRIERECALYVTFCFKVHWIALLICWPRTWCPVIILLCVLRDRRFFWEVIDKHDKESVLRPFKSWTQESHRC